MTGSRIVAFIAAVAGAAVAAFLTVEHYDSGVSLACPRSATINCEKVTTSSWASVAGVPVALVGLVYFVVMSALIVVSAASRVLRAFRLSAAAAGVLAVVSLVYVELFEVDAICLWCTAVHILVVVLFAALLWEQLITAQQT